MLSSLPVAAPPPPPEEKTAKQPKRPEVGLLAGGASLPLRALSVRTRIVDFVANVLFLRLIILCLIVRRLSSFRSM